MKQDQIQPHPPQIEYNDNNGTCTSAVIQNIFHKVPADSFQHAIVEKIEPITDTITRYTFVPDPKYAKGTSQTGLNPDLPAYPASNSKPDLKDSDLKDSALLDLEDPARLLLDSSRQFAPFTAGQYVFVFLDIDNQILPRAYSISSSPKQAREGILQLCIETCEGGKASNWMKSNWKPGSKVLLSKPEGSFTFETARRIQAKEARIEVHTPSKAEEAQREESQTEESQAAGKVKEARISSKAEKTKTEKNRLETDAAFDSNTHSVRIVALAAGSAITPFLSMAHSIVDGDEKGRLLLLYAGDTFLFEDQLTQCSQNPNVKGIFIPDGPEALGFSEGKIDAAFIGSCSKPKEDFYYICGPRPMAQFVKEQLDKLNVPKDHILQDLPGETYDPTIYESYIQPEQKKFRITIQTHHGTSIESCTIEADSRDSILKTLEKHSSSKQNLTPLSKCRSGQCGWCHAKLIEGEIFVPDGQDVRTEKEKEEGIFCPCISWPLSDLVIARV